MLGSQSLDKVKAKVDELLVKLKENYEKHKEIYAELYEAYQKRAVEALQERTKEIGESTAEDVFAVDMSFDLEPPDDHRQDYERAIGMLELHKNAGEETISITPQLYAAYMQDLWGWEQEFWHKNTRMYGVKRRRR